MRRARADHHRRRNTDAEDRAIAAAIDAGRLTVCPARPAAGLTLFEREAWIAWSAAPGVLAASARGRAAQRGRRALLTELQWFRHGVATASGGRQGGR